MHTSLQHIITLAQLLKFGTKGKYVEITTSELGNVMNRSQQSASKYLVELEKAGLVERTKTGHKFRILVTDKGVNEVRDLYEMIKRSVEILQNTSLQLEGKIISGMGEGAYYMSLDGYRKQFKEKLGYEPFAGTLNVKLLDQSSMRMRSMMDGIPPVFVQGFNDALRSYGWVKCYPALINGGIIERAAVIVLERTHYDNSVLELIAPTCIKDKLGIRNGAIIRVNVLVNPQSSLD